VLWEKFGILTATISVLVCYITTLYTYYGMLLVSATISYWLLLEPWETIS